MKSTILCRAGIGPASLPEHAGNPYHTGCNSQRQHRKLQEHTVHGGEGRKLDHPFQLQSKHRAAQEGHNPEIPLVFWLPKRCSSRSQENSAKARSLLLGGKGSSGKREPSCHLPQRPPFEADPKLSCCSGSPDPLLDLVSPRHFPLSSDSTALQRWELLKAFVSDAQLFTDILNYIS